MDQYLTGATIRSLREAKGLTQVQLAEKLGVTCKAVSKWETAKGLPDIMLIEPLAQTLGVSVTELMAGSAVSNRNVSGNMMRSVWYVCPVCGNILHASGTAVISCCGVNLTPLEAEEADESHAATVETVEDERFVTISHEMTKQHYISWIAYVTGDRVQMVKLYPEGNAETRLQMRGRGYLLYYCNVHGLMKKRM